eukprot:TRINITY_DN32173_c0_g1_i1.p2 TRINITY_DN32173_c0_g1~~TRINITY_DN32173_c0_g1_i1.p2  ORF type:complete len:300 (+),score=159.76 TRINITY_DN32173_c0_g1_i1:103-1002(+)
MTEVVGTEGRMMEYERKVEKNKLLRAELMRLNEEIDSKLRSKGVVVGSVAGNNNGAANRRKSSAPAGAAENALYNSPLAKENELLKKENARLTKRLRDNPLLMEVQQIRNVLANKQKQIDDMEEKNRTLEQVARHQCKGIERIVSIEEEMATIQRQHQEETHRLKEELKTERQGRDEAKKRVSANQAKLNTLRDRIKAAKSPLLEKWASVDQVKQTLATKDVIINELTAELEKAKKSNGTDEELKTLRKQLKEKMNDATKLQKLIKDLKLRTAETDKLLKLSASPYMWKNQHPQFQAVP